MVSAAPTPRRSGRLRRTQNSEDDADAKAATEAPDTAPVDTSLSEGVRTRRTAARGAASASLISQDQPSANADVQRQADAESAPPGKTPRRGRRAATRAGAAAGDAANTAASAGASDQGPASVTVAQTRAAATDAADSADKAAAAAAAADGDASAGSHSAASAEGAQEADSGPDAAAERTDASSEEEVQEGEELGSSSEDDAEEADLSDDLLQQLAAGMAAALRPRQQSATESVCNARGGTPGAGPSHAAAAAVDDDLPDEHDTTLTWVPQSALPRPLAGRELTHGLAAAAKQALCQQARQLLAPPRDERREAREARKAAPDTAGSKWFDLPATPITPQVKQDLRLLALRGAFDPKRFYRRPDSTKFPKYFQMGTIVEGPADFYTGRLTRKERKQTLTEELLADKELQEAHKRRFGKLQAERGKWAGKRKGRKSNNPRLDKKPKRPRH